MSEQFPSLNNAPKIKTLEESANYEGNWTLLFKERLLNPKIKEQFLSKTKDFLDTSKLNFEEILGPYGTDKEKQEFLVKYHLLEAQLLSHALKNERWEDVIEHIFSQTVYIDSSEKTREGTVGDSLPGLPDHGTLYKDRLFSNTTGQPFSDRQKTMIEAHEKGHNIRIFYGELKKEIESSIDVSKLSDHDREYLAKAEEIIERMAWLKDYFGFHADEIFTKEHLEYAREHFRQDMQIDLGMGSLLNAVTPEKEQKFLEIMNSYGV